jgi:hypothetical protein
LHWASDNVKLEIFVSKSWRFVEALKWKALREQQQFSED